MKFRNIISKKATSFIIEIGDHCLLIIAFSKAFSEPGTKLASLRNAAAIALRSPEQAFFICTSNDHKPCNGFFMARGAPGTNKLALSAERCISIKMGKRVFYLRSRIEPSE